jgi:hypothetical protein
VRAPMCARAPLHCLLRTGRQKIPPGSLPPEGTSAAAAGPSPMAGALGHSGHKRPGPQRTALQAPPPPPPESCDKTYTPSSATMLCKASEILRLTVAAERKRVLALPYGAARRASLGAEVALACGTTTVVQHNSMQSTADNITACNRQTDSTRQAREGGQGREANANNTRRGGMGSCL